MSSIRTHERMAEQLRGFLAGAAAAEAVTCSFSVTQKRT
jgi:hypothetical protein